MVNFDPTRHIRNVLTEASTVLTQSDGTVLEGISGRPGAGEEALAGMRIGVDRIVLEPGSEFELHTHEGDHILYVLASEGFIHVDGTDFRMRAGDTVYVPAKYPHGVKTDPAMEQPLEILAFGVPHAPLDSPHRMTLVGNNEIRESAGRPDAQR
ncbi:MULTISPECIES: cupin domain-containing protein [unclassified Kitasatospora]|uniref:cupin domain-containing protein n=1 Tax=unclassified Kitasatospora TaxID=2633591 RepID=UPI003410F762